ncbi:MAG: protein kinase, partial [Planctomycetes bacterium]|nr:protein kinase [Planctomycetota bacterium]
MELGQLLLERGLISPQELDEALAEQRRCILQGRDPVPRLGEILVTRGCLTEQQVAEALESQQKGIFFCSACNVQVNVDLRPDVAGYRCGSCHGDLIQLPEVRDVRVADTSVILVSREPLPEEVQQAAKDPARKFGKYILLEEIGRGGAAIVHRAWDTYLNQYVALKFIKRPADGDGDKQRHGSRVFDLLKEARSAIRLRHPNIVTIYDVGRIDRQFYIAMDSLEGSTLAAIVRTARERGKLSPLYDEPRRFVGILRDVARAAHYAHTRQTPVIHCDLKPSNIFIEKQGKAFILDFGLARHLSETDAGAGGSTTAVRGTPSYMAPEQAAGRTEDIDARTDVYGIGAILYEMLAGRPPFSGEVLDLLRRVINEPPEPPSQVLRLLQAPDKPHEAPLWMALERICLKALQKDKNHRYQNARELADDFDRLLKGDTTIASGRPGSPRPVMPTPRHLPAVAPAPAPTPPQAAGRLPRHWRGLAAIAAGSAGLLTAIIALQPPQSAQSNEEGMRAELEALRRNVEAQAAALELDLCRRAYGDAARIVPPDGRTWLEDAQEEIEWLNLMRDRLIRVINKPTRYAVANFRLRADELRDAEILKATPQKLVLFAGDHAVEVAWSALDPETVLAMINALLLGADGGSPADRLGLGIYCLKNGFQDRARAYFEGLTGTDFEIIARRYLARLEGQAGKGAR